MALPRPCLLLRSTLEPLTKEQQKISKANAAAAAGGAKKRASSKGKKTGAAAAVAQPAALAVAAGAPGSVVGLCLLPVHFNERLGRGVPGKTLFWAPLAAGLWGGTAVTEEAASQGRHIARQLLTTDRGAIVAFGMQGARPAFRSHCMVGRVSVCLRDMRLPPLPTPSFRPLPRRPAAPAAWPGAGAAGAAPEPAGGP